MLNRINRSIKNNTTALSAYVENHRVYKLRPYARIVDVNVNKTKTIPRGRYLRTDGPQQSEFSSDMTILSKITKKEILFLNWL